jgi:Flp pilus assembly protein TadG
MAHLTITRTVRFHRIRRCRGLATVELAIILPVLLILAFGIIEYGWMFTKAQEVTNAARQGARVAARADSTQEEILAAINSAMTTGGMGDSNYGVTFLLDNEPWDMPAGQQFAVRVTVAYSGNIELGMPLIPKPGQLSSTITMTKDGL